MTHNRYHNSTRTTTPNNNGCHVRFLFHPIESTQHCRRFFLLLSSARAATFVMKWRDGYGVAAAGFGMAGYCILHGRGGGRVGG